MAMQVLDAQVRDLSKKAKDLRNDKKIPAVCYGQGIDPISIMMDYQDFRRTFREVSTTQVFNLKVDGDTIPVLVHEVNYNPLDNSFDHVDLLKVNMTEKVDATVPIEVEGVSNAVKNFDAVLNVVKDEIEVRCLPGDIPHELTIDISVLENIGDSFHVKDLNLGDKVQILDDPEEVLVSVSASKEYEETDAEVPEELKAEGGEESNKEENTPKSED
ncbi:50S ribosomal protein L25 [Candidatus Peregrinibacteria bacterium]|nr:50S ribosomal protein L25 [Candidatus Peregrinibacteria bacterium]